MTLQRQLLNKWDTQVTFAKLCTQLHALAASRKHVSHFDVYTHRMLLFIINDMMSSFRSSQ